MSEAFFLSKPVTEVRIEANFDEAIMAEAEAAALPTGFELLPLLLFAHVAGEHRVGFEHGAEAGVHTFRPILTERQNRRHERPEHWRRILAASCAQCERLTLPDIAAAVTLTELCAQPNPAARFVATQAASELGPVDTEHALLVVGPEGGLADAEVEQLLAAGFAPRSLGPLTLRSETAVIAGATRLLQAPQ